MAIINHSSQASVAYEATLYEATPIDVILADMGITKSEKIRRLAKAGMSRWDISKKMDIRYQFVRNVLTAPEPKGKH